jgi:hypothetical protein
MGHDHAYGGLLSGCFLQEGEGKPEEETVQMDQRKEVMWTAVMDTVETGWIFLQGIGAPEGISLVRPDLVPQDWDFGEYLTEVLETLRGPNSRCAECGGRLTAVCPDCTAGDCLCGSTGRLHPRRPSPSVCDSPILRDTCPTSKKQESAC